MKSANHKKSTSNVPPRVKPERVVSGVSAAAAAHRGGRRKASLLQLVGQLYEKQLGHHSKLLQRHLRRPRPLHHIRRLARGKDPGQTKGACHGVRVWLRHHPREHRLVQSQPQAVLPHHPLADGSRVCRVHLQELRRHDPRYSLHLPQLGRRRKVDYHQ